MKIIILQSSPNLNGSTALLSNSFKEGSESKGHSVELIELKKLNIKPCSGCIYCGYEGPCREKDDMTSLRAKILSSDMIVFATPLYYYGMSAQLKTVIDRFCAFNSSLTAKRMKSALISVAWNSDSWTFDALEAHYNTIVRYLSFKDQGQILGKGCGTVSMTRSSRYVQDAYELGKRL